MKNNGNWISSVGLTNFRCLPDAEVGFFRRFNIIVGRNGAGKTSLVEAIEVALTGAAYRLSQRQAELKALARDRSTPVVIEISGPKGIISRYDSGVIEPGQSDLLNSFYKIPDVDGRKARYLLPQLFSTHNLLYSERIVQFLGADEREELKRVFTELTLGRDVVDAWGRIERARDSVSRIMNELKRETVRLRSESSSISESIKKSVVADWASVSNDAKLLYHKLPHWLYIPFKPASKLTTHFSSLNELSSLSHRFPVHDRFTRPGSGSDPGAKF